MTTIGVIGNGFVGNAVATFFEGKGYRTLVHDKDPARTRHLVSRVCGADFVFICVPTPTNEDGTQDLEPLEEALRHVAAFRTFTTLVVIKSTVLPGTCRDMAERYDFPIVFNPEFLSARTAVEDFAHPKSIILGGREQDWERLHDLYALVYADEWTDIPLIAGSFEMAELIKYARNTFFALKVAWWNEVYNLCEAHGIPYGYVRDGVVASGWVNPMHMEVPGPDGQRGFGGACFPKDTLALVRYARDAGVPLTILETAFTSNERIRGSGEGSGE